MKKIAFLYFMLLLSGVIYAQDVIIQHNGDSILCSIVEVSNDEVSFKYPNENLKNTIPASEFKIIKLSSGRTIQGRPRTLIRGGCDWEKVITSSDERIASNLEFVGEFRGTSTNSALGRYGNSGKQQIDALNELKRQASSFGCHLLLITDGISGSSGSLSWASATVIGKAYRYKDIIEIHPTRMINKQQDIKDLLYHDELFGSLTIDERHEYLKYTYGNAMREAIKRAKSLEDLEFLRFQSQIESIKEYVEKTDFSKAQKKGIISVYDYMNSSNYSEKMERLKKKQIGR